MSGRKGDYFRLPALLAIPLVPFGMALVTAAAFMPHLIPYTYLGPVGTLTKYLVTNYHFAVKGVAVVSWLVHVGEAYYAGSLCRTKNLNDDVRQKWVIQTFIYGVFSLRYLLAYQPSKTSKTS